MELSREVQSRLNDEFLKAAGMGKLEELKDLVKRGADVKTVSPRGTNASHHAAFGGHLDVLKWLYEQGVDITVRSALGSTPAHMAASNAKKQAVEWLVEKMAEKKADLLVADNKGKTMVDVAHPTIKDFLKQLLIIKTLK